jgi:hypothetical protein
VNCVATYCDVAHRSWWIGDMREFPNPRLTAFETVDRDLEALKSGVSPIAIRGSVGRQFEMAVGWLLWAYGLSVAQMDSADQSREGPDILAVAPSGGIAIVECTVGILKTESKLAKVARRAISIRERLDAKGFQQTAVLPIIVTALRRQEVESEIESATEAGVLVLSREDIDTALNEIRQFPDGDRTFQRGMDALRASQTALQTKRNSRRP